MYESNGEKYFVFDSHLHFWDASPANWKPGAEEYAKGWIECFHAYQGLGPAETHWSIEHFQKYSVDDFEKDVFNEGHVDIGVFQSTYLKEWYTEGFNDIDHNAALLERFPGKLIVNGRWDPREGEAGLKQLEADHAKYGIQGVKLYTAEWYQGSRGWKLTDPEAVPFLDMCADLGIQNIHVHKGPTIWPLDKDAFDVSDVDHVATNGQGGLAV
jgi:predicted TIM-barrel fold metal-dependent hydrolase